MCLVVSLLILPTLLERKKPAHVVPSSFRWGSPSESDVNYWEQSSEESWCKSTVPWVTSLGYFLNGANFIHNIPQEHRICISTFFFFWTSKMRSMDVLNIPRLLPAMRMMCCHSIQARSGIQGEIHTENGLSGGANSGGKRSGCFHGKGKPRMLSYLHVL